MYKAFVLVGVGLLSVALTTGCGTNDRDNLLRLAIESMGDVASMLGDIKKDLTNTAETRKNEKKELTDEDWKKLTTKAEEFKKLAERAQAIKQRIDQLPPTSEAQKKHYAQGSYASDVRSKIADIDAAERGLDAAINEAEKLTAAKDMEFAKAFRKQMKDGKDVFELLTKRS